MQKVFEIATMDKGREFALLAKAIMIEQSLAFHKEHGRGATTGEKRVELANRVIRAINQELGADWAEVKDASEAVPDPASCGPNRAAAEAILEATDKMVNANVDREARTVTYDGKTYDMDAKSFPTARTDEENKHREHFHMVKDRRDRMMGALVQRSQSLDPRFATTQNQASDKAMPCSVMLRAGLSSAVLPC